MARTEDYKGIIPALVLPLNADLSIDEPEMRRVARWLAGFKGIAALMTNGHTGDVFSLTLAERAAGHHEVEHGVYCRARRGEPHRVLAHHGVTPSD